MALLADGGWIGVEALQPYDGSAMAAAQEEGIDLQAKLALSEAWITDEVEEFLRWEAPERGGTGLARLSTRNVVIDGGLTRWHAMNVLAALYRDASFSQANDRYDKKYQAYAAEAAQRRMEYFQHGVAYVLDAVRQPAAPVVRVVAGTQAAAAYGVAITQLNAQGAESAGSTVTAVTAPAGTSITVTAPPLTSGMRWNVYVLAGDGVMRKQNEEPLAADATWALPDSGVSNGDALGAGQCADGVVRQRRLLPRG